MGPKLQFVGLRSFLLQANEDLLRVHNAIAAYGYPTELTMADQLVLALEDRRFFNHLGVDVLSAFREIFRLLTGQRHGGASTIDMQLIRTVTGYKERTLARKLYEGFLSLLIQGRYSKFKILRGYLSIAYFGWDLMGIEQASKKLYNANSWELNVRQAAIVAAMLVYPHPKSPSLEWRRKLERRANYGVRVYTRHKKRFEKLSRSELV